MTQSVKHTEEELRSIFQSLLSKYEIKLVIDPIEYEIQSPATIDVEHDEQGNLVGIGVYDGMQGLYFQSVGAKLLSVLLKTQLIAHNGVGDFDQLRSWGINVKDDQLVWDTLLIGHIQDSSLKAYGLKDMAKRELGIEYPEYEDLVGKHKGKSPKSPKCPQTEPGCCGRRTLDKWPTDIVAAYNAMDTYSTFRLYERQRACIQP